MGIKNLAYCILEVQGKDNVCVKQWSRVNIGKDSKNIYDLSSVLIDLLDDIVYTNVTDMENLTFLIENQPVFKAPTMKSLQMVIYTYAMMMRKNINPTVQVKFISASSKLKYIEQQKGIKIDKSYKDNKNASIRYTEELIKDNEFMMDIFKQEKKKDDLCDTYLQALYFLGTQ
jgi:hypothetical protein